MVSGNCIYVEAPDAETDLTGNEYNVIDFVLRYGRYMDGNPTEAGHEYITAQILNALNITYYTPEEPEVLPEGLFRLKGATRYETGFAIANQVKELLEVEKFETVVVAYGEKFPDALTGSYLAAKYNAPILLTDKKVDADVVDYINKNLVAGGKVFILGGEAAVTAEFESAVEEFGFEVERLKGSDRYATNLAILNKAGVDNETEILIATGNNYADSLSASATGLPMLLVNKELTAEQKAFLEGTSKKFAILGGTAAVSAEIEAELAQIGEVVRVKGASRYETSVVIAERYFSEFNGAVLAYGEAFPDGLCGGPLAALIGGPLILTHNDKLAAADALIEGINYGYVTGGTARLTDATVQDIFDTAAEVVVK
jgi:putative cell wall-binding protein